VEKPRVEKEEMDILSPEEIRLFLDEVTPKHKPFFLTAVLTGMRRGELLGLRWGDIDWHHRQIHVRQALCDTVKDFLTPKSRYSVRRVDMSPKLVRELKKHKLSSPISELDLVFCHSKGTAHDPDTLIRRHYLPALRKAKIRQVTFHSLRHSNVSMRIEQGQNIVYISRQIGHASVKTTLDIYGHLIKDANTGQAMKLDNILGFVEL
jgi:integrase